MGISIDDVDVSLTSYLKKTEIKDGFDDYFPKPDEATGATSNLKADPQTDNYATVGQAFDYLLRFYLEREAQNTIQTGEWIAENAIRTLSQLERKGEAPSGIANTAEETLQDAESAYEDYLETGTLTKNLLESCIDLAKLDSIFRAGQWFGVEFGESDEGDIVDLIHLIEVADSTDAFANCETAYLNPKFGQASGLIGGADADVIMDGVLADVKVTKYATFKPDYWRQIVGYATLSDINNTLQKQRVNRLEGSETNTPNTKLNSITEIGVYFARHGELVTIPIEQIYDQDNYEEFRDWFFAQFAPVDGTSDTPLHDYSSRPWDARISDAMTLPELRQRLPAIRAVRIITGSGVEQWGDEEKQQQLEKQHSENPTNGDAAVLLGFGDGIAETTTVNVHSITSNWAQKHGLDFQIEQLPKNNYHITFSIPK